MKCKGRCQQEINPSDEKYCSNITPEGDKCMYHHKTNKQRILKCRVCGLDATNRGYCGEHYDEIISGYNEKWRDKIKERYELQKKTKEKRRTGENRNKGTIENTNLGLEAEKIRPNVRNNKKHIDFYKDKRNLIQ